MIDITDVADVADVADTISLVCLFLIALHFLLQRVINRWQKITMAACVVGFTVVAGAHRLRWIPGESSPILNAILVAIWAGALWMRRAGSTHQT